MRTAALSLLCLFAGTAFGAASPRAASEQAKIDWLLAEVRDSKAEFLRNGKIYDGRKASSHLKRKLSFAGSRVRTARDFIAGIATRSEETGKVYEVHFGEGRKKALGDWLSERLAERERGQSGVSTATPGSSSVPRPTESPQ